MGALTQLLLPQLPQECSGMRSNVIVLLLQCLSITSNTQLTLIMGALTQLLLPQLPQECSGMRSNVIVLLLQCPHLKNLFIASSTFNGCLSLLQSSEALSAVYLHYKQNKQT